MSRDNLKNRADFDRRVASLRKKRMKILMETIDDDDLENSFIALANYWQTVFISEDVSYSLASAAGTYGGHASIVGGLDRRRHNSGLLATLNQEYARHLDQHDVMPSGVKARRH